MNTLHSDKSLTHPFKRLGAPTHVRVTERGTLRMWFLDHNVVLQHVEGYVDDAIVDASIRWLGAYLSRQTTPIVLFDDLGQLTGYDTAARVRSVAWTRQHGASIREVHLLVASRMVAMAVTVANLVSNDSMRSYTRREDFEQALAKAITLRGLPVAHTPVARKLLP